MNIFLQMLLWSNDAVMAVLPRKKPSSLALERCKIISHRGEHDNRYVLENTVEAFRIARDAGAWGIEIDIRWTRDLVPLVVHDADAQRVFGKQIVFSETSFAEVRAQEPNIPTLEEIIGEFGKTLHLMIELKAETFPQLQRQKEILNDLLGNLSPVEDYHILSLDPDLFELFEVEPKRACLPVAMLNYKQLSEIALDRGYTGLSGHFVLLNRSVKQRHEEKGQWIGTGFPTSRNALFRELNRGVEMVFTNHAVKLLKHIQSAK